MGRPRDPEKRRFWEEQIRAWQGSGLTQSEYCRRQGIGRKRFGMWKRRLAVGSEGQASPVRFVGVAIRPQGHASTAAKPEATGAAALTIVTGDGYRIEVGDGFAPATLATLLATLGRL
jgi:transposase